MVEQSDALYTIAQLALALIGFSGIVIALGHRQLGKLTRGEKLQLYGLIGPPLTALVCSFVPMVIASSVSSESSIWRWSHGILGFLHLANFIGFYILAGKWGGGVTKSQIVMSFIGVSFILAHFLASAGLITLYFALFVVGLMQQLGVGISNFILLLIDPLDGTD